MRRFLMGLLAFALVLCALAALTPTALRQYRIWHGARSADGYRAAADALDTLECGRMLAGAQAYNAALPRSALSDPFSGAGAEQADAEYLSQLDLCGNGVMAVLELPKLGETLPVYHGAGIGALETGAGHLAGTSLPVGGEGALCALAARRGGLVAGPFAGLDRLIPGDCFYIRTLQDRLAYEVRQVLTLAPEELAGWSGGEYADACVLITTAPYGADTHRLVVCGARVARRAAQLQDDTQALPGWAARLVFTAPVAAAGLILLTLVEAVRRAVRRHRLKRVRL